MTGNGALHFSILTLFPEALECMLNTSIIGRARREGRIRLTFVNLRDFAVDSYGAVDDHPYGGGSGMVLRVDVADRAISHAKSLGANARRAGNKKTCTILLCPQGTRYAQQTARELTQFGHIILLSGHYEGFDERIRTLVDREISIGDFILTGGEIPAMTIVDSVSRLLPGVIQNPESLKEESFEGNLLEYPHYTRPQEYKGLTVPPILLSGNHKLIGSWRKTQSHSRTRMRRPDLNGKRKRREITEQTD